jgi:hypothetical protein
MVSQIGINLNPLNTKLNPICHLLALLEGATIVDVSGLRVKIINILGEFTKCFADVEMD